MPYQLTQNFMLSENNRYASLSIAGDPGYFYKNLFQLVTYGCRRREARILIKYGMIELPNVIFACSSILRKLIRDSMGCS